MDVRRLAASGDSVKSLPAAVGASKPGQSRISSFAPSLAVASRAHSAPLAWKTVMSPRSLAIIKPCSRSTARRLPSFMPSPSLRAVARRCSSGAGAIANTGMEARHFGNAVLIVSCWNFMVWLLMGLSQHEPWAVQNERLVTGSTGSPVPSFSL